MYDEILKPEERDFTEEDLKNAGNEITPVKSIPKYHQTKQDDNLNPYLNPNLDSDLSATIGKLSKSIGQRKQLQIEAFQLPPDQPRTNSRSGTRSK